MYLVAFPSALVSICQPNWLPRLDTPPWRCRSWISRAVVSSWRARCLPSVSVTRLTHLDGSGVFAVKDSFMVGIKMYILEYPVYIYTYNIFIGYHHIWYHHGHVNTLGTTKMVVPSSPSSPIQKSAQVASFVSLAKSSKGPLVLLKNQPFCGCNWNLN